MRKPASNASTAFTSILAFAGLALLMDGARRDSKTLPVHTANDGCAEIAKIRPDKKFFLTGGLKEMFGGMAVVAVAAGVAVRNERRLQAGAVISSSAQRDR